MKKILKSGIILLALAVTMSVGAFAANASEFTDVNGDDYFYQAVQWGIEEGITSGVGDDRFDPSGKVTRAQVVTFLWRMQGMPTPAATESFNDVETGSWYETAVRWAVENNVTKGTGEGMFSPDDICNRAMCITLLYRIMGSPMDEVDTMERKEFSEDMTLEELGVSMIQQLIAMVREADIFPDVPQGSYYELPVIWAATNGIITDDNTGTLEEGVEFRTEDPCIRAEMISFLYQTKLIQDAANAPEIYDDGSISIAFPREYSELLYREMYATGEGEDGDIIVVSERASREAAEAMGEDAEGAGELFKITRVGEETLHEMLCGDMSGVEVFAKDEDGKYYLFSHPTDVRFVRETTEEMTEDQAIWTELNEWAYSRVRDDIIKYSKGLSPVSYTNTALDIYLAQIAYGNNKKYTVSTTEFGPLKPERVDATQYAEFLLEGNFEAADDTSAPDGEYVVLNFPDEKVRYDFFKADGNLVREVREGYETLYRRVIIDNDVSNTDAMQGWYNALAENASKKEADKSLDAFIGTWYEEIAGRAEITVSKSVAPGKVNIKASWPDSAYVMHTWDITAELDENGKLIYSNGKHETTEFDENGEGKLIAENTAESGSFAINGEGKIVWNYVIDGTENNGTFKRAN